MSCLQPNNLKQREREIRDKPKESGKNNSKN